MFDYLGIADGQGNDNVTCAANSWRERERDFISVSIWQYQIKVELFTI